MPLQLKDYTSNVVKSIVKYMNKRIVQLIKIYLFWMIFHYTFAILYNIWCVPRKWYDILWLPVLFHSPHCKILQWGFTTSCGTINQIVITIMTWTISYMTSNSENINDE